MKYILPILILTVGLFYSCENHDKEIVLQREQAQKINDSILNVIHNNWNYNIPEATPIVKSKVLDWQKWSTFISELNQKPTKNLSAYRNKVENLTLLSEQLKTTIPLEISIPAINVRLNNLNTNIKHLNSFMSLQTIPTQKVISLSEYIKNDISGINNQIEEIVKIKNIPTESGEQTLIKQVLDTTRRANFNFEKNIQEEKPAELILEQNNAPKAKKRLQ